VFVVAEAADGYHLYGRYSDTLSGFTSAWGDYGQPPIPPYPGQRDKGFDMTNAVVWHAGNTLRINVFGTTDFEDSLSSGQEAHKGGKLIELFWDGVRSFWRWGQIQSLPVLRDWGGSIGIEPVRLRVTSTAVIDGDRGTGSVFSVRTSSALRGNISGTVRPDHDSCTERIAGR